jgi:hypothetical protein
MARFTPEQIAEMHRQKLVLFNSVRSFKRAYIGRGPLGAVKVPLGTAVAYLMANWDEDMDDALRVRAIQKMRNRQMIEE